MSFRVRVALALAALAAAATATACVTSYLSSADRLRQEVDLSLEEAARFVEGEPEREQRNFAIDRFGFEHGPTAQEEAHAARLELYSFQFLDERGQPAAPADGQLPVDDVDVSIARGVEGARTRTVRIGEESYRILTVPSQGGGALQVARDLDETNRILDSLRNRYILLGFGVSIAAAAAGWFIAGRSTRSLVKLTAAVEEVSATGRLDTSVGVEGGDEIGRLAASFNRMLGALARSREQQHQLVQDAGHELRTPLTSLRANVALFRQRDRLGAADIDRMVGDLDSELGELTALVNELVELATDSRDEEPEQDVPLERLAHRAAGRLRRRTGRTVVVDADHATVSGRPLALERALSNLLDNAAKFDPGREPIEMTIRAGRVEVRDHGPGIGPTDLPHVFDRFYRSDAARNRPGSGLGLSIVAETVAAHGGAVFAHNHPDGGAVVGFTLPVEANGA